MGQQAPVKLRALQAVLFWQTAEAKLSKLKGMAAGTTVGMSEGTSEGTSEGASEGASEGMSSVALDGEAAGVVALVGAVALVLDDSLAKEEASAVKQVRRRTQSRGRNFVMVDRRRLWL